MRDQVLLENPTYSYNEIQKELSKAWKNMSREEKLVSPSILLTLPDLSSDLVERRVGHSSPLHHQEGGLSQALFFASNPSKVLFATVPPAHLPSLPPHQIGVQSLLPMRPQAAASRVP
jgi:hypothetical protein